MYTPRFTQGRGGFTPTPASHSSRRLFAGGDYDSQAIYQGSCGPSFPGTSQGFGVGPAFPGASQGFEIEYSDEESFVELHPTLVTTTSYSSETGIYGYLTDAFTNNSSYTRNVAEVFNLKHEVAQLCGQEKGLLRKKAAWYRKQADVADKMCEVVTSVEKSHIGFLDAFEIKRDSIKEKMYVFDFTVPDLDVALLTSQCSLLKDHPRQIASVLGVSSYYKVVALNPEQTVSLLTVLKTSQDKDYFKNVHRRDVVDEYITRRLVEPDFISRPDIRGDSRRHSTKTLQAIIAINLGIIPEFFIGEKVFTFPEDGSDDSCWSDAASYCSDGF